MITLGKSFGLASSLTASSGRKTGLGICPSDMDFFQYERTGLEPQETKQEADVCTVTAHISKRYTLLLL